MTQEKDPFAILKATCNTACHERNACVQGFRQMLATENVSQMMATWRDNWDDVVNSKFADIIRTELPVQYSALRNEMNEAGIYLNECPPKAKAFVRVIITDTSAPVCVYGKAQAYVLGEAEVRAYEHAQVYNFRHNALVKLYDYSYGDIRAGRAVAHDRSELRCECDAELHDNAQCDAYGGTVKPYSFRRVNAYGNTIVYACESRGIMISGNAKLQPLTQS